MAGVFKTRNGETVLKISAKVAKYNPSNKIIERINKRTQQSRFLVQFVPAKRSQHVNPTYRNMLRTFGYRVALCRDILAGARL